MGNNVWLQSSGFEPTAPYYDIEVSSSASMVTITSGLTQKTSSPAGASLPLNLSENT
jgi:hypothetical protein